MKYVEIRRGIFSYYEDSVTDGGGIRSRGRGGGGAGRRGGRLIRKNVPLRSSLCTCRAVENRVTKSSSIVPVPGVGGGGSDSNGFVFELTVEGGPRRLWMARSKEERGAWIRAIHEAMIGSTMSAVMSPQGLERSLPSCSGGLVPSLASHRNELDRFCRVRELVGLAKTRERYLSAFVDLWGSSLSVPLQWVRERAEGPVSPRDGDGRDDGEDRLSRFWRDVSRDTFNINGHVLRGDSRYGPERIVGALARCILEFDGEARRERAEAATGGGRQGGSRQGRDASSSPEKAGGAVAAPSVVTAPLPPGPHAALTNDASSTSTRATAGRKEIMSEVQALIYARDIMMASIRSTSNDDSYHSVEALCDNPALVVICPNSSTAEPVRIRISSLVSEAREQEAGDAVGINAGIGSSGDGDCHPGHGRSRSDPQVLGGNEFEKTGWAETRAAGGGGVSVRAGVVGSRAWKEQFLVLSEGVLSYYEQGSPRPHGLKGQLVLVGATLSEIHATVAGFPPSPGSTLLQSSPPQHVLSVQTKDGSKERLLRFQDAWKLEGWRDALRFAIDSCSSSNQCPPVASDPNAPPWTGDGSNQQPNTQSQTKSDSSALVVSTKKKLLPTMPDVTPKLARAAKGMILSSLNRLGGSNGSRNLMTTDGPVYQGVMTPSSSQLSQSEGHSRLMSLEKESEARPHSLKESASRGAHQRRASPNSFKKVLSPDNPRSRNGGAEEATMAGRIMGRSPPEALIQIVVQASTFYKICTADPMGDDSRDTWA